MIVPGRSEGDQMMIECNITVTMSIHLVPFLINTFFKIDSISYLCEAIMAISQAFTLVCMCLPYRLIKSINKVYKY